MKNYATPCAFYGTKEELVALIEPLKELGCSIGNLDYHDKDILVTNYADRNGALAFSSKYNTHKRISAPASNIPLCLALAAMVEGDVFSKRELAYSVIQSQFETVDGLLGEHEDEFWRKATVPEIFSYFGIPFEGEEKKEEVREILGYKAPFDIYTHDSDFFLAKGDLMVKDESGYYYGSKNWDFESDGIIPFLIAKEIVETWEPVYKEVKKIRVEAGEYTKEELQKLIEAK